MSPLAVVASILFSLSLCEMTHATRLHHRLTVAAMTGDVVPEPRSEIHIIENANLKHIFKINRLTGQVSECDYDLEGNYRHAQRRATRPDQKSRAITLLRTRIWRPPFIALS